MKKSSTLPAPESASGLHDHAREELDLELPNAPSFVSRRTPMSLEQVLPLLEERRRCFPLSRHSRQLRERRRVTAEFIL